MQPLLILDGDSLAHRAFHGLPKTTRDSAGRPAGALAGFGNMLLTLWLSQQPRSVIACWDTLETPTYRHEALPSYQAGREFAPELVEQLDRLPELVESFGFLVAKGAGFEADDFLAAAAAAETAAGGASLIVTSDRDAFQLISESVTVLRPQKGVSVLERVGPAGVREAYGVDPAQVCDFIALRGDPSDGIPGNARAVRIARGRSRGRAARCPSRRAPPLPGDRDDAHRCTAARARRRLARLGSRRRVGSCAGARRPRRAAARQRP